jgi:hypothetical protein
MSAVIRVRIPMDIRAVADGGSAAFALVTPMRVRDLLALAVRESIGSMAPDDKFARSVRRTLSGFLAGDFTVQIDGRLFVDPEDVVVCNGIADVRFFLNRVTLEAESRTRS